MNRNTTACHGTYLRPNYAVELLPVFDDFVWLGNEVGHCLALAPVITVHSVECGPQDHPHAVPEWAGGRGPQHVVAGVEDGGDLQQPPARLHRNLGKKPQGY